MAGSLEKNRGTLRASRIASNAAGAAPPGCDRAAFYAIPGLRTMRDAMVDDRNPA